MILMLVGVDFGFLLAGRRIKEQRKTTKRL
jgi:hypothetical protein